MQKLLSKPLLQAHFCVFQARLRAADITRRVCLWQECGSGGTLEARRPWAMSEFDRITQTPGVMGGKACIRGMRVTVGMIVGQIGAGVTIDELLEDYPYLEREDILQAVSYAGWLASGHEVELAEA
jgi:uncharacterized protein (DUF433 family)